MSIYKVEPFATGNKLKRFNKQKQKYVHIGQSIKLGL